MNLIFLRLSSDNQENGAKKNGRWKGQKKKKKKKRKRNNYNHGREEQNTFKDGNKKKY